MSRVAAQIVRLSIQEGEFGDALYVVNSACHSMLRDPVQLQEAQEGPSSQPQPIAFGRPVSPRLAAHAFLHGLVRGGYSLKAQTYARLMIQVGIPIHCKTLEHVVACVKVPRSALPRFGPFARVIPRKAAIITQDVLQLQTGTVTDECTRAAVELLQTARTFGQRRTERMYRVLVSTLLMQGEIIVASLLFVMLIKDWEIRKVQDSSTDEEVKPEWITHAHLGVAPPPRSALLDALYPDTRNMSKILDTIEAKFARQSDSSSDPTLLPYIQSLAIFAMLLDTGQMHTHRVASVVRTLYQCPKIEARVWIFRDGQPIQVKAYTYFHNVLRRLVNSLGDHSTRIPPPLSRRAYNTLLSYSLRHRFSPTMASKVVEHMCVKRDPPIPPDTVTYNILLRSGTLLRQIYIADAALAALRAVGRSSGTDTAALDELITKTSSPPSNEAEVDVTAPCPTSDSSVDDFEPSNLGAALARLESERLTLPQEVAVPTAAFKANQSTLTSYITHLASTGRPENVVDVLFIILPELNIIDHPATNGVAPRHQSKLSRKLALKSAAKHGPYVYGAIINTLTKAGEVGLAERVFILAQQAERASQTPGFADDVVPWRLSIHAYTSMMQGYAFAAHGRLPNYKRSRYHVGSALLSRDAAWQPKARHFRQGYARYVYITNARASPAKRYTKRQVSRRNAMLLYRSMMSGGRALLEMMIVANAKPVRNSFNKGPRQEPTWFILLPDERFFNAALKLFTPKGASTGPVWTPMLHKLARAIVANGYGLPAKYEYLLGDRSKLRAATNDRGTIVHRPYAFPPVPHDNTKIGVLRTVKTRGLPIRKKRPAWLRKRRR